MAKHFRKANQPNSGYQKWIDQLAAERKQRRSWSDNESIGSHTAVNESCANIKEPAVYPTDYTVTYLSDDSTDVGSNNNYPTTADAARDDQSVEEPNEHHDIGDLDPHSSFLGMPLNPLHDSDHDGIPNRYDPTPNGGSLWRNVDPDLDNDGIWDNVDPDKDNDGYWDNVDRDDDNDGRADDDDDDDNSGGLFGFDNDDDDKDDDDQEDGLGGFLDSAFDPDPDDDDDDDDDD